MDRRVAENKIVAFSVNNKGELVCTDDAMPAGYQAPTFGSLQAMLADGKIATAGNDGDTKLALGRQRDEVSLQEATGGGGEGSEDVYRAGVGIFGECPSLWMMT